MEDLDNVNRGEVTQPTLEELIDRANRLKGLLELYYKIPEGGDEDGITREDTGLLDPNSDAYEGSAEELAIQLAEVNKQIVSRGGEPVKY